MTGNRLLFEDGLPVATLAAGDIRVFRTASPAETWRLRLALLGRSVRPDEGTAQPDAAFASTLVSG
jgi:ATP-dependent Lhr-like helicase